MDGFVFGFLDNAILIFGSITGIEVERYIGGNGVRGAMLGAAIGNTVSDGIGAAIDPAMQPMIVGIVVGTLVPIAFIPIVERVHRFFAERKTAREQAELIDKHERMHRAARIYFMDELGETSQGTDTGHPLVNAFEELKSNVE
jgi:hypothetical protein